MQSLVCSHHITVSMPRGRRVTSFNWTATISGSKISRLPFHFTGVFFLHCDWRHTTLSRHPVWCWNLSARSCTCAGFQYGMCKKHDKHFLLHVFGAVSKRIRLIRLFPTSCGKLYLRKESPWRRLLLKKKCLATEHHKVNVNAQYCRFLVQKNKLQP